MIVNTPKKKIFKLYLLHLLFLSIYTNVKAFYLLILQI